VTPSACTALILPPPVSDTFLLRVARKSRERAREKARGAREPGCARRRGRGSAVAAFSGGRCAAPRAAHTARRVHSRARAPPLLSSASLLDSGGLASRQLILISLISLEACSDPNKHCNICN